MDSQNITSFLCRQQQYAKEQQKFFVRKPFGRNEEPQVEDELDKLEKDLEQFQVDDELPTFIHDLRLAKQTPRLNQSDYNPYTSETPIKLLHSQTPFSKSPLAMPQAPSSVRSSLMSPSAKSFMQFVQQPNRRSSRAQYVLVLNEQESLSLSATLNKYDCSSIEMLELCDNKLKAFPQEIYALNRLLRLKLDNNFIKKVPLELFTSFNLELLSLKNNLISTLEPTQIKGGFKSAMARWDKCLRYLDISSNKLKFLNESIGSLGQLRSLLIQSNEFQVLPSSLFMLKNLKQVSLDWFRYANPSMQPNQTSKHVIIKLQRSLGVFKDGVTFLQFLEIFSEMGINLDSLDALGRNKIHLAALEQDLGALDGLISLAPQLVNQPDFENQTPLSLSLLNEALFSSRMLITRGANVNRGQLVQGSLLSYTLEMQLLPFTSMILNNGGLESLHQTDQNLNNPLHYLAMAPNVDRQFLLEFKQLAGRILTSGTKIHQCPNQRNKDGWAPIHLAIIRNKYWMVKAMLDINESVNDEDESITTYQTHIGGGPSDLTPVQLAVLHDHLHMVKLLIEDTGIDLLWFTTKLSRLCCTNQKLFKILQSYERQQKVEFLLAAVSHRHQQHNIRCLQQMNPVKLLTSLEVKPSLASSKEGSHRTKLSSIKNEQYPQRQHSSTKISQLGNTIFQVAFNPHAKAPVPPVMNFQVQPNRALENLLLDNNIQQYNEHDVMRNIFSFRNYVQQRKGLKPTQRHHLLQVFEQRISEIPQVLISNEPIDLKFIAALEIIIFKTFIQAVDLRTDLHTLIRPLKKSFETHTKNVFEGPGTNMFSSENLLNNMMLYQTRNIRPTVVDTTSLGTGSLINQFEYAQSTQFYTVFSANRQITPKPNVQSP